MSLVAYASSDESEPDEAEPEPEEEEAVAPTSGPALGGLFASLPAPKGPALLPPPPQMLAPAFPPPLLLPPPTADPRLQPPPPLPFGLGGFPPPPGVSPAEAAGVGEGLGLGLPSPRGPGLSLPPPIGGAGPPLGLPKPKKRKEPVKIAAPELHKGDSDSEEDEPTKKKTILQGSGEGTGLSALLPQPKNLTVKETNRLLLPHAFSRKPSDGSPDTKPSRLASKTKTSSLAPVVGTTTTTPSPSAIKAAAKSAALQVTKQITQEEDDSDEEVAPENFFSLPEKAEPPGVEPYPYPIPTVPEELPPGTEPEPAFQDDAANAPLEFKMAAGSSGAPWMPKPGDDYSYNQFSTYGDANAAGAYYQFKRLQGKRNRGREEINFVEIKGDDQLSGAQQWMTKSLTEEKTMKSFSKKKGEQPTGQQRRKHQITYLIHQAKERELELKNTWSENKLSRRQTQAKYGF
ncbi:proline-rich protein PRCC isoform X2 [Macaca nemestrina]|uniref:Proline rich mitotic checkpoint control factor n=1 Tax=Macaca nemestrina TaxID=9545 RepID=A0A2K6DYK2_MACNE|nr:proline-rich protein PRCC isoform X1 [Macaca mulatta]XP_045217125.1 proline-rich protein PRCC isoform X2 [Macaca fascicularis]XP_050635126.1 proline-rich protein PRCC isoform X2 [Macaca thibetana thibetana]